MIMAGVVILTHAFIFDCFYYWFHRAQHQWDWLWRFHRVHHSINPMNAVNAYTHITEELLKVPTVVLPLMLIINIDMPRVIILSGFMTAANFFTHSNTDIDIGPLRWFFNDNRTHRLHHSTHQHNFAAITPLLDRLFGTYREPAEDEWPEVGLVDTPPPASMKEWLLMPFK